jgi:cysteine desulfurase family protein (TIGR01976 family)
MPHTERHGSGRSGAQTRLPDASPLDLARVRARFPALARTLPDGRPIVHADAPGGTQVVEDVLAAMHDYLVASNANQHGLFPASEETDALCERVRAQAAVFTGGEPEGIVFGPNMTTLTWHLSRALETRVRGGEIVCTRLDHDANVAPWLALADRAGAAVRWVGLDAATRELETAALGEAVTERTRVIAFPLASNALGTVVDPSPFMEAARAVGAVTFADAVHAAPHVPLDRTAWGIDALACSPYKFFGPHHGLLSADPELLAELAPDKVRASPDHGPERWQTGTPAFEAIAGTGAALGYLAEVGIDAVGAHERALTERFLAGVDALPHVTLHGTTDAGRRTPTFAVTVDGLSPAEASARLAEEGIWAWAGHHYALEPMRALGLLERGGVLRIGFVHYHGDADVHRVLDALAKLT